MPGFSPLSPASALLCCPGLVPYDQALTWQQRLAQARLDQNDRPDVLLVLTHEPVYTLGRGASLDFLKFLPQNSPIPLHRVGRGGQVTHHCPGQLVAYPILNLQRHQPDLHWYLRQLEQVVIDTLAPFGLVGERRSSLTGVWLDGVKVAAIGIQAKRWITTHGLALNICPDLRGFDAIVPCGLSQESVGSLAQFCPHITYDDVQRQFIKTFAQTFHLTLEEVSPQDLGYGTRATAKGGEIP